MADTAESKEYAPNDFNRPPSYTRTHSDATLHSVASNVTTLSEARVPDATDNNPAELKGTSTNDPNLVTWDGPDDPANPKTWSFKRKWLATGLMSLQTFMTPITSSMIAPAEAAIDRDLGVSSTIESQLIFSIFLLAFVFGPLFLGPLSEAYGRVVILQLSCAWFLIFNLVCGFAQTSGEMLAFRFLSGIGACAPQTIGGGVLADLWSSEQRGVAVSLYTLGPLLGPSLGPLIGAWITARTTWRWSFWSVTIFGVCVQVLLYFTLPETYGPRILQRKAQKLRAETGNEALHTEWETEDRRLSVMLRHALVRVFVLLGTQPIVQFLALFMALVYGITYLVLSTFPSVWTDIYGESVGVGGLNYISLMIGLTAGAQTAGRLTDLIYKKLTAREGQGRPEFRVPLLFLATFLLVSGFFMFGWSAQAHTHWIVPNIGAAIFSAGISMAMTGLQTYTIDCYPLHAASAIGATAVARAVTGFSFPLFAVYMFDALGYGWGYSVLAFATIAVGLSGASLLWFYGPKLRSRSKYTGKPEKKKTSPV